jgi:divalent metal cation (Fe/Co/Zn/Cd) transporter
MLLCTSPEFGAVREVRARWTGHKVYGDVTIEVDPLLSVDKADTLAMEVQASLREHIPLLGTAVCACAHPERA